MLQLPSLPIALSPHRLVVRKVPGECPGVPGQKGCGAHQDSHRARGPSLAQGGRLGQKPSLSIRGQMITLCSLCKTEGKPRDPQVSGT